MAKTTIRSSSFKIIRKIIIVMLIVAVVRCVATFILNKSRVGSYEEHVSNILEYKTDAWFLPRKIPEEATSVHYDYSNGWGQGSSSQTLLFRLPINDAEKLRAEIASKYSANRRSKRSKHDTTRPQIATNAYEELVWSYSSQNHGATGGVWYHPEKHEFIFYHEQW